jgi:hypothetical protein
MLSAAVLLVVGALVYDVYCTGHWLSAVMYVYAESTMVDPVVEVTGLCVYGTCVYLGRRFGGIFWSC